jgi:hypothetical protein
MNEFHNLIDKNIFNKIINKIVVQTLSCNDSNECSVQIDA